MALDSLMIDNQELEEKVIVWKELTANTKKGSHWWEMAGTNNLFVTTRISWGGWKLLFETYSMKSRLIQWCMQRYCEKTSREGLTWQRGFDCGQWGECFWQGNSNMVQEYSSTYASYTSGQNKKVSNTNYQPEMQQACWWATVSCQG